MLVHIDSRPQAQPAQQQALEASIARERALSRLLIAYIATGLLFMLLPGTFLGVWNLFAISSRHAPDSVSVEWVQAHGHAQIFGWIGTFILGIGYYSIPKLRRLNRFALSGAWSSWGLWTAGVALRWTVGIYAWEWRILLPLSATMELAAFLIFFQAVSGHRPASGNARPEPWALTVIAGSVGLLLALQANLGAAVLVALRQPSPAIPATLDVRLLTLQTWGCLALFVWGFSARWLPVFLGLRSVRSRWLLAAVALNMAGVAAAFLGRPLASSLLTAAGILTAIHGLRLFEAPERPPKVEGVHGSFPFFVRAAYVWAVIAAVLGVWSALNIGAHGIAGASRHALTVGFLAVMVFAIGQRVLPAFSGMKVLYSRTLMFLSLLLLTSGCLLRVSAEILAYQGFLGSAWTWLPVSAVCEMAAVTLFAFNLLITFARPRQKAEA